MDQSSSPGFRTLRIAAQLLMAFSLLLALAGPLAQSAAASPAAPVSAGVPDPSGEPDPAGLPPDTGEPSIVEEPSDAAPSVDVPSEEPLLSEEPSPSETSSYDTNITIYKWLCPAGYDYTDPDSNPDTDCAEPLDGVPFDLTQTAPGSDTYSTTTGDVQSGAAFFSGFGPGSWQLTEGPSSAGATGDQGFRICNDFGFGNPGAESATIGEPFAFDVPEDQPFDGFCNWYDVPPSVSTTDVTGPAIVIVKWNCPASYDFEATGADPATDCATPADGVDFTLSGAGQTDTRTTGDDASGQATFAPLDPGDYTVTETVPAGTGSVFYADCSVTMSGELAPAVAPAYTAFDDITAADPSLSVSIPQDADEGYLVTCSWYNVPSGNTITIAKWLCPAGYDYTDPDSSPEDDCTEPLDDIEFELAQTAPGTTTVTATTGDDDPGVVRFTDIEPGSWDLTETTMTYGDGSFRICNDFGFGNPGAEPADAGEPFSFDVPEDEPFNGVCNWYNVDTGNSITIYQWLCPDAYDYSDSGSDPATECSETLDGIEFTLNGPASNEVRIATTGDDETGTVTFDGLDPGDYQISETASDDPYQSYVIRCYVGDFQYTDDYRSYGIDQAYGYTFTEGDVVHLSCNWYDIPGGNSVTVYKWYCPGDYDYTSPSADATADCVELANGIDFSLTGPSGGDEQTGTTGDDGYGAVAFDALDPGDYELRETSDSSTPRAVLISCYPYGEEPSGIDEYDPGDPYPITFDEGSSVRYVCDWYNIPWYNSITIHKWTCPYGYDYQSTSADPYGECTEITNAVPFSVTDEATSYSSATGNDGPGTVVFDGLAPATWQVEETPPAGYVAVLIGDCYEEGDEPTGSYSYLDGEFSTEVEIPVDRAYRWVCDWFNILTDDPGEVTIDKWTCPAGYDIYAYGANAAEDCTQRTNGVRFNAAGPDDYASQSDTGDSIDGAVYFGGLVPGDYTFTETLPADTLYVFIADCTGTSVDVVHPYPLSVGNPLIVRVNPGDRIVCNWYNVPKVKNGTIVLTKYLCSTPTYTSAVNCEIYEGGVTFTLLQYDGSLTEVTDGTTGATGQLTWLELPPGQYTVREEGYAPCRITSSQIDGGYIAVADGQTTYVSVYNCTSTSSPKPGTSTKPRASNAPPGKFPDTGVDPSAMNSQGIAPVGGTASPSPEEATTSVSGDESATPDGSATGASMSDCAPVSDPNVPASPSPSDAASGSPSPSPSPSEQEVTEASLAPSPDADEETCARGAVPANITVEAGNIDAPIEIIETIDGVMQAPTGAVDASWYRETSRLGEAGPVVIAGHLNYWNTPEGPFFGLSQLTAGDTIDVTGDDGAVYRYEVQSATQFPSDASPNDLFESVDQSVGGETMVLITCGGEWDTSVSEYNERTVVVASRVPAEDSPA